MQLHALAAGDARVAALVYRLAAANAALCDGNGGAIGLQLHAPTLYTSAYRAALVIRDGMAGPADGSVAVNVVIPDSPADRAGIVAGSWLTAINNVPVSAMAATPLKQLAAARSRLLIKTSGEMRLGVRRNGVDRIVNVTPIRACAVSVEIKTSPERNAQSVGHDIIISAGLVNLLADDQSLAALLAHELAHLVRKHREGLDAAGVSSQLLRSFGRNGRLIRACEVEADQLSVMMLAAAGFDPSAALNLWQRHGAQMASGLFRASTHPSWQARVEIVQAALAAHERGADPVTAHGECPAYPAAVAPAIL